MKFIYRLVIVCVAFCLTGCDRLDNLMRSTAERVTLAYPLPPEVVVARANLQVATDSSKSVQATLDAQFAQLLVVRALTCTGAAQIGRFDTTAEIKSKINDPDCFKKQDATLSDWVGRARVAVALRLPPLRPLAALPAKAIIPAAENSITMFTAEAANIAVVKGNAGKLTVVDLSGGKPLASFQAPGEAYRSAQVSPNGRMLVVPVSNRSIAVYDLETGSVLWSTDRYNDLVVWMPELDALVLNESPSGKAELLDLRTGRTEPYLVAERNLTWSHTMPAAKNQYLIGSSASASLVDHSRNPDGTFAFNIVKQWRLGGSGASSLKPLLMLNGKFLAFVSNVDLGWLNLESGQQGVWAMSAMGAHGFHKLNESTVLFSQSKRGPHTSGMKLLDLERFTVSAVPDISASEGYAVPFNPRSGFARAIGSAVVIHTAATGENPQALDPLLAQAQLDLQLAKLQALAAQAADSGGDRGSAADPSVAAAVAASQAAAAAASAAAAKGSPGANQALIDALSRQVRARNAAAAIHDGLSRETIEKVRNGSAQNNSASASNPTPKPLLADVPSTAQVAVVGVYEARSSAPRAAGTHPAGNVRITVAPGTSPVILALSSYEPVRWQIQNTSARKIATILLSGYHESSVIGADNVKLLKIGSNYAYKLDSPEYERLKKDISRYVSNPVASFQGSYQGQDFTVR